MVSVQTLVNKIVQDDAISVETAVTKVLASLGLNADIDLLHFDPIKETIRTDIGATATNSALATHAASVQIQILVNQTAALLKGAGIAPDETTAIDWAYDALAAMIGNSAGKIALASSNFIARVIQDTAHLSGADDATLLKGASLLADASRTIANLNQGVIDASQSNTIILTKIAAVQIVAENIKAAMESGAAKGNVAGTVISTTGTYFINSITAAGSWVGDVNGDGKSDPLYNGGGSPTPSINKYFLATNATGFSGTAANDILSISTASTWTPLVMTAVVLDGGAGANTLSVQDGSSIALATVINFPNLLFDATGVVGTNNVTMSATQNQGFTGAITAPGTGVSGEEITIAGDGAITTLANIENYSIEDDATNARTVTVANAATNVTADSASDAVTFNIGALAYTGTITGDTTVDDTLSLSNGADISGGTVTNVEALILASGASVRLSAAQNQGFTGTITAPGTGAGGEEITIAGDGNITTLANIETYILDDDATNARALTLSSGPLTLVADNASDTITVNAAALAQNTALTLGASASSLVINNLVGDIVASSLNGALAITTANAADNGISITTASAATSVNVAAGAASDTVSINAAALANNIALTISSGGAAAGTVNVANLSGDMTVSDPTAGTIDVAVTDNTVDDGIAIAAGASNLAISGVADSDTVTVTGFTGSTLTGTIAGTTGKFNITAGTATNNRVYVKYRG